MSEKERKKKDGQDKNKKMQAMRGSVKERHENAAPPEAQTDDAEQQFQSGSQSQNSRANDRK